MDKVYTVQLQGIGKHKAIKACQLVPGNIIVCNYGYKDLLLSIVPSATGKTYTMTILSNGKTYTRKTTKDRLFAIE